MSTDNNNSNNNSQSDWQKREIGAMWKKESATQKYFSGHIKVDDYGEEKMVRVVVFSNRNKTKDNQPDFRIYTVDDSKSKPQSQSTPQEQAPESVEEVL
tara:strand:+ start:455 stop:751 length:297 start_codon:yes stop_codon:yes gene_type:complete